MASFELIKMQLGAVMLGNLISKTCEFVHTRGYALRRSWQPNRGALIPWGRHLFPLYGVAMSGNKVPVGR